MSDRHPDHYGDDEPLDDIDLGPLAELLAMPDVWDEPDPGLGDAVVAAVQAEVARAAEDGPSAEPVNEFPTNRRLGIVEPEAAPPVSRPTDAFPEHGFPEQQVPERQLPQNPERQLPENVVPLRRPRRWVSPLLGAAAALLLVAAIGLGTRFLDDGPDRELALAGTDLAPEASATVGISTTPLGTQLILDVRDLPPAPEGQYYEAWLRQSPEIGVSAGTFHLRGGDGTIELWSGVLIEDYPLVTVTIQDEFGGAASSGMVVLAGRIDAPTTDG